LSGADPGFSFKGARDAIVRRFGSGLLGSISLVAAGAAATRVAATLKDLLVARRFGTGDDLDAFLLAFALPVFLSGMFRSAFYSAFVPRFLDAGARRGRDGASDLLARSVAIHLAVLTLLSALLALFAGPLVALLGGAFPPEKQALTARLLRDLAPFVVLDGASGIYTAALNARGRFVTAALIATIPPVVTLGVVAALSHTIGVLTLVLGAVGGALFEAALAAAIVRRHAMRVVPALGAPGPEASDVFRAFLILAGAGALMSANTVVDQAMATRAGAGSVAALGFGAKIPSALLGLAGLALGTTTLPHYAERAAAKKWDEMASGLRRHVVRVAAVSIVAAAGVALLSRPLVRFLFEHGSFTAADTERVASIQALYALQIPGWLVGIVAARYLNALGRDRWMFAVSALNFVLNAVGDWVLLRWIGLPGIALSTSIFYTVAAVVLLVLCRRATRSARGSSVTRL
jgi:putative peptidoglycan lipid II flippase